MGDQIRSDSLAHIAQFRRESSNAVSTTLLRRARPPAEGDRRFERGPKLTAGGGGRVGRETAVGTRVVMPRKGIHA